jgi:hypothetical protein|tara:strand:+ start:134 stop:367 length:234 start_codon:yes stop_codon:yes gene_type:complete
MTIRKKQQSDKMIIDLTGQDGNAFCLIGLANDLCKKLNRMGAKYDFDSIYADMTRTDYENLVRVFDENFGHLVILER